MQMLLTALLLWQNLSTPAETESTTSDPERPNILWLSFEDHGPQLGCYGDDYADTPVLDSLAARGVRYERCWSNAPVCSTARTTLITGRYATSLGAHHHRSRLACPEGVRFFPQLLREAGYFCTNNRKEDYNLAKPKGTWDMSGNAAHWRKRAEGQPFFAVFNITVSHESQIRKRPHELKHDPDAFDLPPYYPDLPEIRRDWAQEYDKGTEMDARLGQVLAQLREDGLEKDTIVFAFGDHGSGMPRHKRWPGDSGQRVPLIVVVPDRWKHLAPKGYEPGALLQRLVAFVDLGPTVLSLAGVAADEGMHGIPFMGPANGPEKKYLFGYRGRMDERMDEVRVITDGRYVYLWNLDATRPHGAHVDYQFVTPTTRAWYEYARENPDAPKEIRDYWFSPRGRADLFDLQNDPHEIHDLHERGEDVPAMESLAQALMRKVIETQDLGFIPEHLFAKTLAAGQAKFQQAHFHAAYLLGNAPPDRAPKIYEDPIVHWWQAFHDWEIARSHGTPLFDTAVSDYEPGTSVALAIARIHWPHQVPAEQEQERREQLHSCWNLLLTHAGLSESNYFVRLLAWQALDEAIMVEQSRNTFNEKTMRGYRDRVRAMSTDHPKLDGAFRNYIPRLKDKLLREFESALSTRRD
ncbi:MAG: sulfatase [Planctomycetes bacterium]|nr:sulfatase [Planctomycetota bacterium]